MPAILDKILRIGEGKILRQLEAISKAVNAIEDDFVAMSDDELRGHDRRVQEAAGRRRDPRRPDAGGVRHRPRGGQAGARPAAVRRPGQGGAALHMGNIAEMKTGEGKTLVAALPLPEQVVERVEAESAGDGGGDYRLRYERPIVSEGWNAQISLLAGHGGGSHHGRGRHGLLRTLPPPDERTPRPAAPQRPGTGRGLAVRARAGGGPVTRRSCARSIRLRPWARRCSCRRRGRSAAPATPGSRAGSCPTIPHMPPSPRPTPTSRRRCGASADRATNEVVLALVDGAAIPDWAAGELDAAARGHGGGP